jgi:hypothetical protein
MMITERLTEAAATEESLNDLETSLGFRLPDDYRRFLMEFNGGAPEPSVCTFETSDGPSNASVRFFLTIEPSVKSYSIERYLRVFASRIPAGLMPIASDSFGNLFLIDGGAKAYGSVYFWDHELEDADEDTDEPTWDNISLLAPSFGAFVQALR